MKLTKKQKKILIEVHRMSTQDLLDWLTYEGVLPRWQNETDDFELCLLNNGRQVLYERLGFDLPTEDFK